MLGSSLQFEAIGTAWRIETPQPLTTGIEQSIRARIEAFDKTYSRFRGDSLVSRAAKENGIYTFPADAGELFSFYETLYRLTRGKVTPLIGGALERAGYDASYSLQARQQHRLPLLENAITRHNNILETKELVTIDVGAAGKGYLVDIICQLLDAADIAEYVVDASGDLRHKGTAENRVGLEHPLDATKVIGSIDVINRSFCASASNRRRWGEGLHHVFDPDSLAPTNEVIATWVMADSAMVADGLATALFFTDPNVLRKEFSYEYVRMRSDGAIDYSPAFEGKLF
jgi:thiamine biosynthesis lipoprotein